ncbi:MAG: hypothetical protein QOJ39_2320 [Candidatus Eremiobacteraeota bacterium]|jgi:hypothetical protein|nr:hypothetical protein [Candidatus Eremiobacteraeota bacterium]
MKEQRFDDLDLREEPPGAAHVPVPGFSFQTHGCNNTRACTNTCCPPSWDACA